MSAAVLKAERFLTDCRSFLSLASKSKTTDKAQLFAARASLLSQLEKRILTTPSGLASMGFRAGMTLEEKRLALDVPHVPSRMNDVDLDLANWCKRAGEMRQQQEWKFRIGAHAELLHHLGWYPFFVTLTLDPAKLAPWGYDGAAFWKHGKEWQKFRRDLVETVARTMGVPVSHARSDPNRFMQYCGVLEHGKSRNHHHMHCLIWMREIPASWKMDPNRNNPRRNYLECLPFKRLWKYGANTKFCYFRYKNDVWRMRHDFKNPVKPNGQPMTFLDVQRAGVYLAKYMSKEHKEWSHRMKCTRNLGLVTLIQMVRNLPDTILEQATRRITDLDNLLMYKSATSCPNSLLRRFAKRETFSREWKSNLPHPHWIEERPKPFMTMRKSCQDGQRPWLMPSPERFAWLQSVLPPEKIAFSERFFHHLVSGLADFFPRLDGKPVPQIIGH